MATDLTFGIIDDDRLLRTTIGPALMGLLDWKVTVTAASVSEALASSPPTITLLDLNLRDGSAPADNVTQLVEWGTRVVMLSTVPDVEYVLETIEAGAWAYVTKDASIEELAQVVEGGAQGDHALTPDLARYIAVDRRPVRPRLSPRQYEVARLYSTGMPLKSVARRLGIAESTAHEHLRRLKAAYTAVGRVAHSKVHIAQRLREDRWELHGLD